MSMKKILIVTALLATGLYSMAKCGVVAHRGYWQTDGSAQNSLRSLAKADSIGVCASEFDVWITADDSLIVNHDAVFKGVDIERSTFADVRKIRLDNGEIIPTLDEYLTEAQQHPSLPLILELKEHKDKNRHAVALGKIVSRIITYGLKDRVTFISFDLDACRLFHSLMPDNDIYYLNGDLDPAAIKALGFTGIDYSQRTLLNHPQWIKEAHDLGLKVNVWTVNDDDKIQSFYDQGVDFITTNRPEQALKIAKQ